MVRRSGTMRLVASPHFDENDIEAIQRGYEARESVIERALLRRFEMDLRKGYSTLLDHRLDCLAWLIAEGRLEVRIAVPRNTYLTEGPALFHEKVGLFLDANRDVVAFTGSANETVGGLVSNFESIDVYLSWDDPHGRVAKKMSNFKRLWENNTRTLDVYPFPQAVKERILEFRSSTPPGEDPEVSLWPSVYLGGSDNGQTGETPAKYLASGPCMPTDITLRPYQQAAIRSWLDHDCKGLLQMATGTGKTITSLAAAVTLFQEIGRLFLVISVPYQHLVDQWANTAMRFGLKPVLAFRSRSAWEKELARHAIDYRLGVRNIVCTITTHTTLASETFQKIVSQVTKKTLFIADEAHHLGAAKRRGAMPDHFRYRLGLSATPSRWFDDEGTSALLDYFGGTVYEFGLKEAIDAGCLTPYTYHPILVNLTDEEMEQYEEITTKIARLWGMCEEGTEPTTLETLLRRRADILNRASNKLSTLQRLVLNEPAISHALFYCAPGQIWDVVRLLGSELSLPVHPFTAEEAPDVRIELLDRFDRGLLKGLVAMKCLDEGVDVPSTRTAFILASSSNPREFIQRRGRVLRLSPGKSQAKIYDLIAVPPRTATTDPQVFKVERGILRRELARFREFADTALNRLEAIDVVWDIAKKFHLLDF